MMKKIFSLIMIFLYVIPAIGINITVHYCGKNISSVVIGSEAKPCACGSKKSKKSCCHNEEVSIKLDDSQQKTSVITIDVNHASDAFVPATFLVFQNAQPSGSHTNIVSNHHPPDDVKEPLYIINSVFRI